VDAPPASVQTRLKLVIIHLLNHERAQETKARNLDGATFTYAKRTINRVECHGLVRDEQLVAFGQESCAARSRTDHI
jgi:hypothetical protein